MIYSLNSIRQPFCAKTKRKSYLVVKNSHLPIVLLAYRKAMDVLLAASNCPEQIILATLNFKRCLMKFENKLSQKDKIVFENFLMYEIDHETIDQLARKKHQINNSCQKQFATLLALTPASIWQDDFVTA